MSLLCIWLLLWDGFLTVLYWWLPRDWLTTWLKGPVGRQGRFQAPGLLILMLNGAHTNPWEGVCLYSRQSYPGIQEFPLILFPSLSPTSLPACFLPSIHTSFLPSICLSFLTWSHYIALAGLELDMWIRLASILQRSTCHYLPSAGFTGMYHRIWVKKGNFKGIITDKYMLSPSLLLTFYKPPNWNTCNTLHIKYLS